MRLFCILILLPTLLLSQQTLYLNDTLLPDDKKIVTRNSDFDGDGRLDLFTKVSVTQYPNPASQYEIHLFNNVTNIGNKPDMVFFSDQYMHYGFQYEAGYDINGDEYDDLIVTTSGPTGSGGFLIYFGTEEGIDNEPDMLIDGYDNAHGFSPYTSGFGGNPRSCGDFNGDGYNDLFAMSAGNSMNTRGALHIFFGGPLLDGLDDNYIGGVDHHPLGQVVSIGDLNGDGYDDLVSSSDQYNVANIYMGSENGLVEEPILTVISDDISIDFKADADFNGDGSNDLLYQHSITENRVIYFDINFNIIEQKNYYRDNGLGAYILTLDINGDEYSDLAFGVIGVKDTPCVVYTGPLDFENEPQYYYSNINNPYLAGDGLANIGDILGKGYDQMITGPVDINTFIRSNLLVRDPESLSTNEEISRVSLISKNYPEPFNPTTTIEFDSRGSQFYEIAVYNLNGEIVYTYKASSNKIENETINFDGSNLSSGTYLYTITASEANNTLDKQYTGKLTLIK